MKSEAGNPKGSAARDAFGLVVSDFNRASGFRFRVSANIVPHFGERSIDRILAIDYGRARHGLALSDPLGITAQPLAFVPARDARKALDAIAKLCEDRGVTKLVVGLPLRMDGTEGPSAAEARRFADAVAAKVGLPVEMWDERLTTAQAERAMLDHDLSRATRKARRDSMAAQIFLQTWLDAHRSAPGAP